MFTAKIKSTNTDEGVVKIFVDFSNGVKTVTEWCIPQDEAGFKHWVKSRVAAFNTAELIENSTDYAIGSEISLEETIAEIELTPEQIAMNEWFEDYRTLQASLKLKDVAVATNQPVSAEEEAMIQTLAEKVRTNQKPEYVKFI